MSKAKSVSITIEATFEIEDIFNLGEAVSSALESLRGQGAAEITALEISEKGTAEIIKDMEKRQAIDA